MALKTFKPYTPARRNMTVSAFEGVDKKAKPERGLVETLKKHSGRNNYGHITVRHQGGGGTIAKFMANRNIETIDAGVPVLSMHAPCEAPPRSWPARPYPGPADWR